MLLTFYGIVITLLHLVNIQTIFLIQPKTLQFIQKNSVYYGSRCYGCDDLIQNGYEKKNLHEVELLIAVPSAADHFSQRLWIRETWGQKEPSLFKKKAIYFFLGNLSIFNLVNFAWNFVKFCLTFNELLVHFGNLWFGPDFSNSVQFLVDLQKRFSVIF